jgi:hypothetical protein
MKEATLMKVKTLLLATTVLAMATGGAFAQTSTPGAGTTSQPEAGSSMSQPTGKDAQKAQMQKDKSPASTNSGTAQEK